LVVRKQANATVSGPIDYRLRILDIDQAASLPVGQPVQVSLASGLEATLFSIDATTYQTLTLTPLSLTPGVSAEWAIRLRDGRGAAAGGAAPPLSAVREPAGRYTLVIRTNQTGPVDLSFQAAVTYPPAVPVSGFGAVQEARLGPGEQKMF